MKESNLKESKSSKRNVSFAVEKEVTDAIGDFMSTKKIFNQSEICRRIFLLGFEKFKKEEKI